MLLEGTNNKIHRVIIPIMKCRSYNFEKYTYTQEKSSLTYIGQTVKQMYKKNQIQNSNKKNCNQFSTIKYGGGHLTV